MILIQFAEGTYLLSKCIHFYLKTDILERLEMLKYPYFCIATDTAAGRCGRDHYQGRLITSHTLINTGNTECNLSVDDHGFDAIADIN